MSDYEKTFKIKVRFRWTVSEILLTSVVTYIWRVLHGKKVVQYHQNYKRHDVDGGHSKKLI